MKESISTSTAVPKRNLPLSIESGTTGLFRRLEPVLRGLSRRIAGERLDLRNDYYQEGALAIATAAASFVSSKGDLDHYAARSARGKMLNYRRSLRAKRVEVSVGLFAEADFEEDSISDAYEAQLALADNDQRRRMEQHVDATTIWASAAKILTANERRVMRLIFFESLRPNEAAQVMGVSAPRITQLFASGVRKLRDRFNY
jgi:RNA polymerase sigma factor (sigma-70 family)